MIKLKKDLSYNIVVVGVGGTGSHLVSFLSQMIGNNEFYKKHNKITLVDADIVEEKNLRTQKFLLRDVGQNKAEVLSDRYQAVFNMDISYMDKFIEKESDIERLMSKEHVNIIVSCVDNNKARKIIDDFFNSINAILYNIIYIDTGNSSGAEELTGQTVIGYRETTKIKLPSVSTYFPQMLQEENEPEPVASCGEEMLHNIQNIGANITSACTVFNILNSIIAFNVIPGDLFMFNASKIESQNMQIN